LESGAAEKILTFPQFIPIREPCLYGVSNTDTQQSGLTQKVFAAQVGISCSALNSWLRRAHTNDESNRPQFVAVPNLLATGPGSAAYRLQWPDGFTLEVVAGFAAPELSALLQVVRRV
jgi:hypothetical protein